MSLTLGRKHKEAIVLKTVDGLITVRVYIGSLNRVLLVVDAPASVTILREELVLE